MKKVFYLVAIATLALLSCQKEIETETTQPTKAAFTASIENLASPTRADIDNTNNLVWKTGDKIGIYVDESSWGDKNQPFHLSSGEDSYLGGFDWDYSGWSDANNVTAAFFPWDNNDNATDGTLNNVFEGYAYFTLNEGIYSYSSGKLLTPLVAPLTKGVSSISFKHAGAAVKVHINNVPKRVHSIGMSVAGQQVTGEFKVSVANAGIDAMAPVAADNTKNTVWINIWNGAEAAWDFIFPVPELTKPKLSFQMYDENDILVWQTNLKAQDSDLGRGKILVMPDLTITPYSQFSVSADWTLCGKIGGIAAWDADIPMYTDGTVSILKGMSFKAGDEFKIRKGKAWDEAYPSDNYAITEDCTKDVWFNNSTHEITLKDSKCDYPAPKVTLYFGINNPIPANGIALRSDDLAPGYSWPGRTVTDREMINGKWYYKYVVDGTEVWGKTLSGVYIVGIDSWNTNSSTISFTDIKTEYYFEATSSTDIEQLNARPAEVTVTHTAITIDGNTSEWADVDGATNGNNTIKVESDASNIYVYSLRTTSGRYSEIWNGNGYVYVGLDLDGDETNGETLNGNGPYDFVGYFNPYGASYTIGIVSYGSCLPNTCSISNVVCLGTANATDGATIEFNIPRADIPSITASTIKVTVWGNKDMSKTSIYHIL